MTKNNNIVLDDQFWEKYEKTREWFLTPTEKKKPKDSYKVLASYHLVLERAVFWSSREDYRLLVRDFVNKKIDRFYRNPCPPQINRNNLPNTLVVMI